MKCYIFVTLIFLLGSNYIAQNFTIYGCLNCGSINSMYSDTTVNKLYMHGVVIPRNEINATGVLGFQNGEFSAVEGLLSSNFSRASCRFNEDFYMSGDFYSQDSTEIYTLVKWDGLQAIPVIVQGQIFDHEIGTVNGFEVLNNELYIYGGFQFIDSDGIIANGIAKLVNGEFRSIHNFPKWSSGEFSINIVDCIAMYKNEFYVGGRITDNYPIDSMRHVCKWNGTNWQMLGNGFTLGGGAYNDIVEMVIFQNKLYIAGSFDRVGGVNPGKNIAVWNGDNWEETIDVFHTDLNYGGKIWAMKVFNDELYIAGIFNSVAGISAANFAKFDGNEWCTFGMDILNDIVFSMEEFNDELYLAGAISFINGIDCYEEYNNGSVLAKLNSTGTIYSCIDVASINEQSKLGSEVFVSPNPTDGIFEIKNSSAIEYISILDVSGKLIREFTNLSENLSETLSFDISDLPSGFYKVLIKTKVGEKNMKLFKN